MFVRAVVSQIMLDMDEFTRYQPGQETRDYDLRLCVNSVVRCLGSGHIFRVVQLLKPILGYRVSYEHGVDSPCVEIEEDHRASLDRLREARYFGPSRGSGDELVLTSTTDFVVLLWNVKFGITYTIVDASCVENYVSILKVDANDVSVEKEVDDAMRLALGGDQHVVRAAVLQEHA